MLVHEVSGKSIQTDVDRPREDYYSSPFCVMNLSSVAPFSLCSCIVSISNEMMFVKALCKLGGQQKNK